LESLFSMTEKFFPNTLPLSTKKLIKTWQANPPKFLNDFYLSGGTALSLQIGHRESEDLDFFSQKTFDPEKLQQELMKLGNLTDTELDQGTLNTFLNGVKLQFLEYPYRMIKPLVIWQSLQLSSVEDIACTKLQTIAMRGSKKDFVDLYFLLQRYQLKQLFEWLEEKYQGVDYNQSFILKSLIYFKDAQKQPMPRMLQPVTWEKVKSTMVKAVREVKLVSK
jgi:predicted nucleotidyltransferase component of viral defense system